MAIPLLPRPLPCLVVVTEPDLGYAHVYHVKNDGHPNMTAVADLVELGLSRFETFSANFTYRDENWSIPSNPIFERPSKPVEPSAKPAVVEQPPFVERVAPKRRCGKSPWLGPEATAKDCAARILAEPAETCSRDHFVYADLGDGNCACAPRGSACSTSDTVAAIASLYRIVDAPPT